MDREQLKERLLKTGMEAELVDAFLATLDDDQLLRTKDMSTDEVIAALKEALEDTTEGDPQQEDADGTDTDSDTPDDTDQIASVLKEFGDGIVNRVVSALKELEVTVEAPGLDELAAQVAELKEQNEALQTTLKEMTQAWDEILKTDKERLQERLKELSPAARTRLQATLGDKEALGVVTEFLKQKSAVEAKTGAVSPPTDIFHAPIAQTGQVRIVDSEGQEYASLGDLARGQPKS